MLLNFLSRVPIYQQLLLKLHKFIYPLNMDSFIHFTTVFQDATLKWYCNLEIEWSSYIKRKRSLSMPQHVAENFSKLVFITAHDGWMAKILLQQSPGFFSFNYKCTQETAASLVNKQKLSSYRNNTTWGKLFGPHTIIHRLRVGGVRFPIPSGGWWYFCQGQGSVWYKPSANLARGMDTE